MRPRPPEPRLAWAYVPAAAAARAAGPLPYLGPATLRALPAADGASEPHRLTPVGAWAHLPPRARPRALCPVCLEPVTLKLGRRVRHHYAHAPHSACRAATPEGALHLSAKLRLAEGLAGGGEGLVLERLCHRVPEERGTQRCGAPPLHPLALEWDEVRVEEALPSLRADLLLLRHGEPVLAVEVYATHAVDEERAARYRALGVPWVEVSALRVAPAEGIPWEAGDPLPVLGDSALHPARWRCPRHEALYEAYREHQRNGVHWGDWRVVHLYRREAGVSASLLRVEAVLVRMVERREEGLVVEGWLQRDDRDEPLTRPLRVEGREAARRALHAEFLRWARWTREARGAALDSPMPWTEGPPPPPRERRRLFPERLRWSVQSAAWEGAPGLPALAWPLPLHEAAAPHPVYGDAPAHWTEPPARDQGPLLHALVPPVWLTLRPHHWEWEGVRHARGDFSLHHHDGRRWVEMRRAAFSHEVALQPGAAPPRWEEALRAAARAAAHGAEALAGGTTSLAEIARPHLP